MDQFKKPFKGGVATKNLYNEKSIDDYLTENERKILDFRESITKAFEEAYYASKKD